VAALAADLGAALEIAPSDLAAVLEHCSGASAALALLKVGPPEVLVERARPYLVKDVAVVREVAAGLGVDLGLLGQLAEWVGTD